MRPSITDTSPAIERVQIELLRKVDTSRRAQLARSLSANVISLSRAALAERMPGAGEQEILLRWAELNYGSEIAARVRAHLGARR